jgi:2,3-bisphosphoglycerate-dependent phosphoglycerate mutase
MYTNIYFVRHAQADHAVKDDCLRPLTPKGLADTKKVTAALHDKEISAVYSSPYQRAYDTVKDFADSRGLKIVAVDNFRERKMADGWIADFKTYSQNQWRDFEYKLAEGLFYNL